MKKVKILFMDIQSKKLTLIQWLINLKDETIISKIEALTKLDLDFWNELSNEQKTEIERGLKELDAGEKYNYEDAMLRHR